MAHENLHVYAIIHINSLNDVVNVEHKAGWESMRKHFNQLVEDYGDHYRFVVKDAVDGQVIGCSCHSGDLARHQTHD